MLSFYGLWIYLHDESITTLWGIIRFLLGKFQFFSIWDEEHHWNLLHVTEAVWIISSLVQWYIVKNGSLKQWPASYFGKLNDNDFCHQNKKNISCCHGASCYSDFSIIKKLQIDQGESILMQYYEMKHKYLFLVNGVAHVRTMV